MDTLENNTDALKSRIHGRCLPVFAAAAGLLISAAVSAQEPPRTAFVHLFEWRWDDIALECEEFLGPAGFAAVQVSPPNEHRIAPGRPWWERYQPVSYALTSRSGDHQAFADMIQRCEAAGVAIYVDAVLNHMTGPRFWHVPDPDFGTGSDGSPYDYYAYPIYSRQDFHACDRDITNYGDRWEVQNCNLVGLADLDTAAPYVRGQLADYLNDLIGLGVAGFRIDAAKHMAAADIAGILAGLQEPAEIYQEVIEGAGEGVAGHEYFANGLVTEFDFGLKLAEMFRSGRLADLRTFGEDWQELMPSDRAVVFVDNHDNQRGHGGGGGVLTHEDGALYDLANALMLAWPYGYPRIMSSYAFEHPDQGPPQALDGATLRVHPDAVGCSEDWVCEHRRAPIANMVAFRNHTLPAWSVDNWWSNGNDQIAFGRGNLGFVVINGEGAPLDHALQTGLPPGAYCNAWDDEPADGSCTGSQITVAADGTTHFSVPPLSFAAIHVGAMTNGSLPEMERTVILIEGATVSGQDMFIRGGIDHDHARTVLGRDCTPQNLACAIPIRHRNLRNAVTEPWKRGDHHLDWYGAEPNQSTISHGIRATGSALDWTTDAWPAEWGDARSVTDHGFGEEALNRFGPHFWMLDVDMDCTRTADGWFEIKSFIANGAGWESDVAQPDAPYASANHFGRCGFLNVFRRGIDEPVEISPLD